MAQTTSPDVNIPHFRRMALGFVAGPLTWGIYFLAGYMLIEVACKSEAFGFSFLGLSGVSAVILGLTVAALLIVLFFAWWTYRKWQERRTEVHQSDGGPFADSSWLAEGHVRFMTFVGLLLNVLFAVIILFTGLAVFFLQPC